MKHQRWMIGILVACMVAVLLTLLSYRAQSANAQIVTEREVSIAQTNDDGICPPQIPRTATPDPRYIGPPVRCTPVPHRCATPLPRSIATRECL